MTQGIYEKIEIFRAFRNRYDTIDDFYDDFFRTVIEFGYDRGIDYKQVIDSKEAGDYDRKYGYYSKNDRIFRYLREVSLRDEYAGIMEFMMKKISLTRSRNVKAKARYDIPYEHYGIFMYHPVTTNYPNLGKKIIV